MIRKRKKGERYLYYMQCRYYENHTRNSPPICRRFYMRPNTAALVATTIRIACMAKFSIQLLQIQYVQSFTKQQFKSPVGSFYSPCSYILRLFMCQDENKNEPEDESFRSFWIHPVTNEPRLSTMIH